MEMSCLINSLWPSDTIWWQIWDNIGSGNGLLPDDTKPIPEPMLAYHQRGFVASNWDQFPKKCSRYELV